MTADEPGLPGRGAAHVTEGASAARCYSAEEVLKNGTVVTIRAVRPDDVERLTTAFARLDPESVYRRFFAYRSELGAAELARIAGIDFLQEVMLVAVIATPTLEVVVGSGRYVADATLRFAEVAFTVEEDFQGLGLAGRLLAHLAAIARDAGIARFDAHVLPENKGMLKVFRRSGLPMRTDHEDGLVHVVLELGQEG